MAMSPAMSRSSAPPRWQDYVQLLKPRVMSLVIFTAITGLVCASAPMNPVLAAVAIFCIAVGAGASAAFNMWYDADIDAKMRRTRGRPVPAGKVQDGGDLMADPQLVARDFWRSTKHAVFGERPYDRFPAHWSTSDLEPYRLSGAYIGEDNFDVYRDLAGMTEDEIGEALATGLFG